jgi:sporulation protein YlmC with PRC-barrel domain
MLDERDLRELAGHPVVDCDGKSVGYVDQIFNDDQTGEPEWIGVITGTFRHHVHLVPASGVGQEDGALRVPWTKDRVHNAPEYGGGDQRGILGLGNYRPAISEAKEREAHAHYGLGENM